MAAMTSRFNIRCVIQYYSDQWWKHIVHKHIDNDDVITNSTSSECDLLLLLFTHTLTTVSYQPN